MSRRRRNKVEQPVEQRDYWERGPCGGGDSLAGLEGMYPLGGTGGVYVNSSSALTLSSMWNGVTLISTDIASLPCRVYRETALGKTPVPDHPVNRLLDYESNPYVDAFHFEAAIFVDAILNGNGYAEIVRDPNTLEPAALFNIPHSSISPEIVSDPENSITGNRLVYRLETAQGDKSYLLAEDVLHLKGTTEPHGLLGISLIDKALQSLGLSLACQTNAANYFSNGSRADGFMKFNGTMSPKQKEDFRRDFYREHGGGLSQQQDWLPDRGMELDSDDN